jgi:hypothetical protein
MYGEMEICGITLIEKKAWESWGSDSDRGKHKVTAQVNGELKRREQLKRRSARN